MRIVFIIAGIVAILGGVACAAPSVVTYRSLDSDGYINGQGGMHTRTAALVTDTAQFRRITQEEVEEGRTGGDVILRISAERNDGGDVVVAVGSAEALQALLVTGSYENVSELNFEPFRYSGVALRGTQPLNEPEPGLFAAYSAGPGRQEISWTIEAGDWRVLIMNADGAAQVDVNVRFGARFPYLRGYAIAGMVIGTALLLLGIAILAIQFRPGRTKPTPDNELPPEPVP